VKAAIVAVALLWSADIASADALIPLSYRMYNGDGVANSGSYNYWDDTYTGYGDRNQDHAALYGGLGQLTDGATGTEHWIVDLGNGPAYEWVGWVNFAPTITFDFGSEKILTSASFFSNNDQVGGVYLWDTASFAFSDDDVHYQTRVVRTTSDAEKADTSARFINTDLNGILARYVAVTFTAGNGPWIFLSEAQFEGGDFETSVPEPSAFAMLATGLLGIGLFRKWGRRFRLPRG
jgi:hypothetical protein